MSVSGFQIVQDLDNPILVAYPSVTISGLQLIQGDDEYTPVVSSQVDIPQYGNFFLMYEESAGVWVGPHNIDINPLNNAEIEAVIGSDSTLTSQELYDLADTNPDVTLVWAEDLGVNVGTDTETNLAKVLVNTISGTKEIWTFSNIS